VSVACAAEIHSCLYELKKAMPIPLLVAWPYFLRALYLVVFRRSPGWQAQMQYK